MDNISFLLFFIYTMVILITLVYISPKVSAVLMIIVPVAFIYIFPEPAVQFFSSQQFFVMGVPIHNIHLLLFLWFALLGIVVYSKLLLCFLHVDITPPK